MFFTILLSLLFEQEMKDWYELKGDASDAILMKGEQLIVA